MNKFKEVKEFLLNDIDLALELARECNSWDGSFDFVDVWDIEELCECGASAYDMVRAVYDMVCAVIYGNVRNVIDPVRYNAYGYLETVDDVDLENELKDYYMDDLVNKVIELYEQSHITVDSMELEDILDAEFDVEEEAQKVYTEAENHYKGSEINADTLMRVANDFFEYEDEELEELEELFVEWEEEQE